MVTKWFTLVVKSDSGDMNFEFLLAAFSVFVLVLVLMYVIYKNWGGQKGEDKEGTYCTKGRKREGCKLEGPEAPFWVGRC